MSGSWSQEQGKPVILAVDDTPANIDVLREALSRDYVVQAATGGAMALKIVERKRPDLILLDIMMPEMDGFEVCSRLKDNDETRDIPVIFVTAKSEDADEVAGFELGAVDYVTKPVNLHRLRARVRNHIALARAQRRLAEQNEDLIEAAKLREDVERITRHDLKSPLTSIIGVPQLLLLTSDLNDKERQLLLGVEESGRRMLDMINLSLDLFKMERGVYEFRPRPVDLVDAVGKVFFELEQLARIKKIELRLLADGKPPSEGEERLAQGEPLLCHSMLANLCKNAVEASPNGETVTIDIRTGKAVVITITNAGEAPEEFRPRFFEKYATHGKKDGTGLGAYSAKLIAETQNGEIELDSSTPGTTRIVITLQKG